MRTCSLGLGLGRSRVWTPSDLPNLAGWFESDFGITLNGSTVSGWADRSGLGHNLSQGTAGQQPTYNANDAAYNNRPTLSFLASSSQCLAATGLSFVQPMFYAFVGEITNANGSALDGSTATYENVYFGQFPRLFSGSPGLDDTTGTSCATKQVVGVVFNGASSAIYVNNSQTPEKTGTVGGNGAASWSLGGAVGGSGDPFMTGKLAAFIAATAAPSAANMKLLFAYLGARFGASVS